eukprot:156728_1
MPSIHNSVSSPQCFQLAQVNTDSDTLQQYSSSTLSKGFLFFDVLNMNDLNDANKYISIKLSSSYNGLNSQSYLEIKFYQTKILFNTVNPLLNTTDNIIEINNNGYNNLTLTKQIFDNLNERKDFWMAFSATDDDGYGYFRFGSGT